MLESSPEQLIVLCTFIMVVFIAGFIILVLNHRKRIVILENEKIRLEKEKELMLSEAVIKSQENERKAIGEDLHDEIGPLLSTVQFYLKTHLLKSQVEDNDFVKNAIEHVDSSINRIRNLSHVLHPASLDSFGLSHAVSDFCNLINSSKACNIESHANFENLDIPRIKELMIYRIIQELILNALKHGNANDFKILMESENGKLSLSIEYRGLRFEMIDYQAGLNESNGLGIKNIQHRLNLLNGTIDFQTSVDSKIQNVHINIPIN